MTIGSVLQTFQSRLEASRLDTPRLDVLLLAAHLLGKDRSWIMAHETDPASPHFEYSLGALVQRRLSGESIAYICGLKEFFGHDFEVGPGVLVPRPDTETLVEWVLEDHGHEPRILRDVCTGTACIPVSIAFERPRWTISASDISPQALVWARMNIERHLPDRVKLAKADLLTGIEPSSIDIVTANPPYIPESEVRQKIAEGWKEPELALDGGTDGLDLVRTLLLQARTVLRPGGYLYLEFGDHQSESVLELASASGWAEPSIRNDLAGLPRILRCRQWDKS